MRILGSDFWVYSSNIVSFQILVKNFTSYIGPSLSTLVFLAFMVWIVHEHRSNVVATTTLSAFLHNPYNCLMSNQLIV
jgi:hypothetical protein